MSFASSPLRKNRDLWIAVLARAVSLLGDEAAVIALTLRLHDNGSGAWSIAFLFAAGMLPLVLLAPLAGALVDRFDSRHLLVWSGLAQAALCFVLAQAGPVPLVLGLVAALGAGQAVNSATWAALLPSIVGTQRLPAAMGMAQAARTTAGIAAPAVGGVLTGLYGPRVPLLLDASTFVLIAVAGLLVRTRRQVAAAATRRRGGYDIVRDDPVLVVLLTMLAAFIVLGAMMNVVAVFLVRDTLRSSATWYGIVSGAWSAGMLLGALTGGRWRTQQALARIVVVSTVALSASMLAYGAAPEVGWLIPVAIGGGAANGLLNLGLNALAMMRAPEDARGRVAASVSGVASAAMIGAFVLGGALSEVASPRELFLVSGVLGLLVPFAFARSLLRAVPREPSAAEAATASA